MDISKCVVCECTGKTYKNIKTHQKSQIHQAWVTKNELRDLKIQLTQRDNMIVILENKINQLQELNTRLISDIVSIKDTGH